MKIISPSFLLSLLLALLVVGCNVRRESGEDQDTSHSVEAEDPNGETDEPSDEGSDSGVRGPAGEEESGKKEKPSPEGAIVSSSGNMEVTAPGANQQVSGEGFVLRGRARTFENALSYWVMDKGGKPIAEGHLTAVGETGHLNPYTTEISIASSYTGPARLEVFQYSAKDGSRIDIATVPIVVTREKGAEEATLRVYFANARLNGNGDCENVFSVPRSRGKTAAVAEAVLKELLRGPSVEEKAEGYASEIPTGTALRGVKIDKGVATADFSSALNRSAGSCRVAAIRAQIERTLKQFPSVKSVVISVDGNSSEALQP